jgi:hypothetical protein
MGRVAVVVGGTGLAGYELPVHLLEDFSGAEAFDKVAVLSRSVSERTFKGKSSRAVVPLRADLGDAQSVATALRAAGCERVTHVFWLVDANRPPKLANAVAIRRLLAVSALLGPVTRAMLESAPSSVQAAVYGQMAYLAGSGSQPRNIEWLGNMLAALELVRAPLENWTMCHGGKHYGMHLGPSVYSGYATPFEEDEHKCVGPLSYFEMQDWLEAAAAAKGFSWNVVRPTFIMGSSPERSDSTQNLGLVLAIYAHVLRAQGKPLLFPGSAGAWEARIQLSTSKKVAHVAAWAATASAAGLERHRARGANQNQRASQDAYRDPEPRSVMNQAFNVVSCDEFSWRELWPQVARYFAMAPGPEPDSHGGLLCLDVMGGAEHAERTWGELRARHGLQDLPLANVFNADFLDKSFVATWDSGFSSTKLARAGFPKDQLLESDPLRIMVDLFAELQDVNLIPRKPSSKAASPRRMARRAKRRLAEANKQLLALHA